MRKLIWLLPLILILALAMAVTTSVSAAANFEIENPTISPNPAKEGDIITISCVVKNTGDTQGTYTLELKIDGTVTDTEEVADLDAGASQTVNFQITAGPPNDYTVELGSWSDNFTVTGQPSFWAIFPKGIWVAIGAIVIIALVLVIFLAIMPSRKKQPGATIKGKKNIQGPPSMQAATPIPTPIPGQGPISPPIGYPTAMPTQAPGAFPMSEQFQMPGAFPTPGPFPAPGPMASPYPQYAGRPAFSVSNLTITPNQAKSGEPITISAIVFNNGSEMGTYGLVLRINGMVENIIDLTLPPGASQSTTFTVIKDAGGDYYAEVDGLGGAFTIMPLVPANFSVSNLGIAPERVKQGEKVTISAIVTNNGEIAGNYSMVVKLKGAIEGTEEISLGPGESRRVDFGITKNAPGFYNVEVENLTGRFVVEMEWQG